MGAPQNRRIIGLVAGVSLAMAACGSDDSAAPEATDAAPEAAAVDSVAPTDTESESPDATVASGEEETISEPTGEPFILGVQNAEGDPSGSFPEYSLGAQAAVDYVNAELGGFGGRPIEVELCKMVITPDDSQRCANELSASGVDLVLSTLNFFGNHFSIYNGVDIPVIVGSPITIGDFTSEGVYAIGAGGGCLGSHTGIVEFITNELEEFEDIDVERISSPFQDSGAGNFCYKDMQEKPLDVLAGDEAGDSVRAGERPGIQYLGIPIAPATPDVTPQATQTLDFDPDVITYVAQIPDCYNFLDSLSRLGWTADEVPLVFATSCTDFDSLRAAGESAVGIYFVGAMSTLLSPLDTLEGRNLEEATTYQTKASEYGLPDEYLFTGFASGGFRAVMNIWQIAQGLDGDVTAQAIEEALAATDGSAPTFGSSNLNCSGAPEPYITVCNAEVSISRWNGESLEVVEEVLSGVDLVAGTEVRTD